MKTNVIKCVVVDNHIVFSIYLESSSMVCCENVLECVSNDIFSIGLVNGLVEIESILRLEVAEGVIGNIEIVGLFKVERRRARRKRVVDH